MKVSVPRQVTRLAPQDDDVILEAGTEKHTFDYERALDGLLGVRSQTQETSEQRIKSRAMPD